MRSHLRLSAAVVGVPLLFTALQAADPPAVYKLPKDPKTPVVVLNFKGGFTPPRLNQGPTLSIFPDGTVLIPKVFEGQREYTSKLTPDELQALLREIIEEHKFFEYDAKAVAAKVAKAEAGAGFRIAVADAATTEIKVTLADKKNEAAVYNLAPDPKVPERRQLHAVQRRLMRLMSVIQVGGAPEVERWLKVANEKLKAMHPDVEPLTAADFEAGSLRADDSRFVQFQRREPKQGGPDEEAGVTVVSIQAPAKGDPQVNVTHRPAKGGKT